MLDTNNDILCAVSNKNIIIEIYHYVYTLYRSGLWFKVFFKDNVQECNKGRVWSCFRLIIEYNFFDTAYRYSLKHKKFMR